MNISTLEKDHYPFLLQQISSLPPFMYKAGADLPTDNKYLCVVGSRNHTSYGADVCKQLILGLTGYPISIVSGLAIGIDSIAHETALEAGLHTVAFPGSGLSDRVLYPPSRKNLAERIITAGGTILSPFTMDQGGTQWTFPSRNRLMAGVSHAVLVIEAGKDSGTLLTANNAGEFSRDVLAVPGSIFSEVSYGPHMLLRNGATAITSSTDILEALGFDVSGKDPQGQINFKLKELSLSPEEKLIVDQLKIHASSATDILENIDMSSSTFNMTVSELELKEVVECRQGMYRLKLT